MSARTLALVDEARGQEDAREWRCERCDKLLGRYRVDGRLWEERVCPRCAHVNRLEVCEPAA